ncbi:MAG: protein-glutamine glutaminase family protein [Ginsengibacter sp.]
MIKKALFYEDLSDEIATGKTVTKEEAQRLFIFFRDHTLFRWFDANNDCEDRANAICILLDEWKIRNGKGWVFSGYVFKKTGFLKNLWKYHVAALVPVLEGSIMNYYIIDPATSAKLILLEDWAVNITDNPHSYYLIKQGDYYIFHQRKIKKDNWYKRNKGNFNWTMQGISGINGISDKGRAELAFNKKKVLKTKKMFSELRGFESSPLP